MPASRRNVRSTPDGDAHPADAWAAPSDEDTDRYLTVEKLQQAARRSKRGGAADLIGARTSEDFLDLLTQGSTEAKEAFRVYICKPYYTGTQPQGSPPPKILHVGTLLALSKSWACKTCRVSGTDQEKKLSRIIQTQSKAHRPCACVPLVVWAWDFLLCGFLAAVSRPLLSHCFSLCDLRLFVNKRMVFSVSPTSRWHPPLPLSSSRFLCLSFHLMLGIFCLSSRCPSLRRRARAADPGGALAQLIY